MGLTNALRKVKDAFVGAWTVARFLASEPGAFSPADDVDDLGPPGGRERWTSAPCVTISGTFVRFHRRGHGDPTRLHTLLLDAPENRGALGRFAPAGTWGHFFATTTDGARSEAGYYGIDLHDRLLLEVAIVEFPNVLDLTNERVLRDAVANVTAASDAVASRPYSQSLAAVLDQTTRGNAITDEIGRRAYSSGFSGIRFFGARAISDEELRHSLMQGAWAMWFEEEAELFAGLRAQPELLNLVGFHGAHVVRHVSRFRIDGGEWRDNPLFGCSPETIEQVHKREGLPVPPEFDPASWIAVEPHADSVRPTLFRP